MKSKRTDLTEHSKGANQKLSNAPALLCDIRGLIESAREQTARADNSTLVLTYWQFGQRIRVAQYLANFPPKRYLKRNCLKQSS